MRYFMWPLIAAVTILVVVILYRASAAVPALRPSPQVTTPGTLPDSAPKEPETVAKGLDTPWALVFLPDGSMLVTERHGAIDRIDPANGGTVHTLAVLPDVRETGEGGLLGMALDPDFSANGFVYLYYTYRSEGNDTFNRVVRMRYMQNSLTDQQILVDGIPGSGNHNGGRIRFGPDRLMYVTTGDAENPSRAQDTGSLGGKILRMTAEGKTPPDNPFGTPVYSYGHRNPQGLAWDASGRLWATEHGRSGLQSGLDEVNMIVKGKNYGWPVIQGDQAKDGMETPYVQSGPTTTWAPAGAAIVEEKLYFGGLRGAALYRLDLRDPNRKVGVFYKNRFGRIRDVELGPDGFLYLTTSNRDGRGIPGPEDDRIIRVDLRSL